MRVIVIGAGLGGLCLAQGLRKAGVEVEIYERDKGIEARFQGYRIGLGGPGLAALRGSLPDRLLPLLDATSGELSGPGRLVDEQLRERPLDRAEPLAQNVEGVVVDRHVLRHLLLAGLSDRVHFDKRLTHYIADDTVRATFADGSTATGDVLVGADGIGSAVRSQLVPGVEQIDTGLRGVIGRTPLTERFDALVPGRGTMVCGPELDMLLGTMPFRRPPRQAAAELAPEVSLPDSSSYLRWVMLLPPEHPGVAQAAEHDGQAAVEVVLDLIAGWHPELLELVRLADRHNSSVGSVRVLGTVPAWSTGRVTLLGDAAHATSPTGGNGANTAFRDAELLCGKLTGVARGDAELLPALGDYERQLLEYGSAAVQHSLQAAEQFKRLRNQELHKRSA